MNRLDRLFLRIAKMSRGQMQRTARDGKSDERGMARVCLTMDYAGQKREANGQFGTGKKAGGSSAPKKAASSKSNIETLSKRERKQAHELSNAITSGKAKLRESGMSAHMPNTPEYRKHSAEMSTRGLKASHFSEDYKQLIPEIKDALKSRNAHYTALNRGSICAKIDLGRTIGTSYGKDGKSEHQTNTVTVVYSEKNGDWHFYPDDD